MQADSQCFGLTMRESSVQQMAGKLSAEHPTVKFNVVRQHGVPFMMFETREGHELGKKLLKADINQMR